MSMIDFMSTSLKVVSMAVVFFAATKCLLTVLRNELIFSRRSFLLNATCDGLLFLNR